MNLEEAKTFLIKANDLVGSALGEIEYAKRIEKEEENKEEIEDIVSKAIDELKNAESELWC